MKDDRDEKSPETEQKSEPNTDYRPDVDKERQELEDYWDREGFPGHEDKCVP